MWVFTVIQKYFCKVCDYFVCFVIIISLFLPIIDLQYNTISIKTTLLQLFLKLINNSSKENKENHYRDRGLEM